MTQCCDQSLWEKFEGQLLNSGSLQLHHSMCRQCKGVVMTVALLRILLDLGLWRFQALSRPWCKGRGIFFFSQTTVPKHSSFLLQELEIQARAHGLPNMATALSTVELSSHLLKQQQQQASPQAQQPQQLPLCQEDPNSEYLQRIVLAGVSNAPAASGQQGHVTGADGCTTFSDPLSHFTDFFSTTLKEEHRLDEILMEDPLSPFGADPLLSAGSPGAVSKDSSRRSSFSSGEGDDL